MQPIRAKEMNGMTVMEGQKCNKQNKNNNNNRKKIKKLNNNWQNAISNRSIMLTASQTHTRPLSNSDIKL